MHCARLDGGAVLALGRPGPVTRALAGTYRCTAASAQGAAVKDVTLTVECEWGVNGRVAFAVSGTADGGGLVRSCKPVARHGGF